MSVKKTKRAGGRIEVADIRKLELDKHPNVVTSVDLSGLATVDDAIAAAEAAKDSLAKVAKSGSYLDLNDKPETAIPVYGTRSQWESHPEFVPAPGQIVIWTDKGTTKDARGNDVSVPGFKVGDGNAYNLDIPFVGDDVAARLMALIMAHVDDAAIHVSEFDRARWDNKVTTIDSVSGDTLVFTRN